VATIEPRPQRSPDLAGVNAERLALHLFEMPCPWAAALAALTPFARQAIAERALLAARLRSLAVMSGASLLQFVAHATFSPR
jgi:hypothetical protein